MDTEIVIRAESGAVWKERLQGVGPFYIGRGADCHLRLDSQLISRRHVMIEVNAQVVIVEDLSSNGTYAGEHLLHRTRGQIEHNAPIVLGDHTLYVQPTSMPVVAPAPAPAPPPVPMPTGRLPMPMPAPPPIPSGPNGLAATGAVMQAKVPP
ncbi:MAG: FHA domain-containing protein, partial [Myxococcales bacterium]